MDEKKQGFISRRHFLKTAGAGAVAAGAAPSLLLGGCGEQPKPKAKKGTQTLKILQWNHFVPRYDKCGAAEVSAQKGHDLFLFMWPAPVHEDQVIDHKEIYQEVERKYGKPIDLAIRSTFNPKSKKFYGFSDSYVPDPINYRKDLWDSVGMSPNTWDDIRIGGAKIKKKHGIPVGIGLSAEIDTGMAMRTIMYSFGSSVQDEETRR
jgi:multiple sugar transport system substrate-binding protein